MDVEETAVFEVKDGSDLDNREEIKLEDSEDEIEADITIDGELGVVSK